MIRVFFLYYRKSTDSWVEGTQTFWDCYKAKRFMWSLKHKNAQLLGYECDDPEDADFLDYNVSFSRINNGVAQ